MRSIEALRRLRTGVDPPGEHLRYSSCRTDEIPPSTGNRVLMREWIDPHHVMRTATSFKRYCRLSLQTDVGLTDDVDST